MCSIHTVPAWFLDGRTSTLVIYSEKVYRPKYDLCANNHKPCEKVAHCYL